MNKPEELRYICLGYDIIADLDEMTFSRIDDPNKKIKIFFAKNE
jgi:hypothetical protein